MGSPTGISVGAGNPINIITGNKYQREVDLPALPGELGLEIVRHYNSAFSGTGGATNLIGRGWKLSYETDLFAVGSTVQIVQADGARVIFNRDDRNPSLCSSTNPADGTLSVKKARDGDEFIWRWPSGRELTFNSRGKLVQILAPSGLFISMQHDARGLLVSVTDPQGRRLRLNYLDKETAKERAAFRGVQRIDSPVGSFAYAYGSALPKGATVDKAQLVANLVKVSTNGGARYYHYENAQFPTLLTGISALTGGATGKWQRVGTYGYGNNGKANFTSGPDKVDQVRLEVGGGGQTTLINSLGQKTIYRHGIVGGQFRLLEVRGAGCATCGASNQRYTYDNLGRLIETIDLNTRGQALQGKRTELDHLGRITQVNQISYNPTNGKAGLSQWQLRYQYLGDNLQPSVIARPSVVPGQEMRIAITYGTSSSTNALATATRESGFLPPLAPNGVAVAISRSTNYRYNVHGQAIETDGPLANGRSNSPLDSDISRREYDSKTKLLSKLIAPGNIVTEVLARDAGLRPQLVRQSDGIRRVDTSMTYTYSGQLLSLIQHASFIKQAGNSEAALTRSTTFTYDGLDRLSSVTGPDRITLRTEYDPAGRPTALIDPKGNRISSKFDSEGKLLAVLTTDNQGNILNGMLNLWDEQNNLRARLTPVGLGMAQGSTPVQGQAIRFDGNGEADASATHSGHTDVLAADNSAIRFASNHAGMLLTDGANRAHAILRDDFGRVVLEVAPDEGRFVYSYNDATGAIGKQQTALDGQSKVIEKLEFGTNGHLIKRTLAGCTDTLDYDGGLLARLNGCGNSHAYQRDAFGQILRHTQTITPDIQNATAFNFTTHYAYDAVTGQVSARRLPDGQYLSYTYDKVDGKQTAVTRDSGWLAWIDRHLHENFSARLRAFLPQNVTQTPLLTDISWRPFAGIRGSTASNGVVSQSTFDRAGRLTGINIGSTTNPGALQTLSYQYDGADNIVSSRKNITQRSYRYDPMHRLTGETIGPVTRTVLTQPGAASLAETAQLTPVAGSAANQINYRYDPLGQRRRGAAPVERDSYGRQSTRQSQRLSYDGAHRLIAVTAGSKTVVRYRYDAVGNRVAKTVDGHTTYFVYDTTHKLVAEANEKGEITTQYLYAGFRPYALMRAEGAGQTRTLYAIHADDRGLPLAVTDANQRVVWQGDFDAFGNTRAIVNQHLAVTEPGFSLISSAQAAAASTPRPFEMNLRMAGQYADVETGLFYNIHRYYDPLQGQYITADPLGLSAGLERYAYVGSNPMSEIDPLGLFKVPTRVITGGNLDPVFSDHGHGDVIRIAFAQYEAQYGGKARFSQTVIDQIIRNAYQTDALPYVGNPTVFPYSLVTKGVEGGGQYNAKNHFDNPNDGPQFKSVTDHTKIGGYAGAGGNWIASNLDALDASRVKYGVAWNGISGALSHFGQNAHALPDFYAHSNWVDATTRGGVVDNLYKEGGVTKRECGAVPYGAGMTRIWDGRNDTVGFDLLYTGTVLGGKTEGEKNNKICGAKLLGDLECDNDRTTHGYWNKDEAEAAAGGQLYSKEQTDSFAKNKIFVWQAEIYDPSKPPVGNLGSTWFADEKKTLGELKKGDRIYVPATIVNYHQMAFALAVQDVKREIANLYAYTENKKVGEYTMHDAFKMDEVALKHTGIAYKEMTDKRAAP